MSKLEIRHIAGRAPAWGLGFALGPLVWWYRTYGVIVLLGPFRLALGVHFGGTKGRYLKDSRRG